jgi:hypothetical protein
MSKNCMSPNACANAHAFEHAYSMLPRIQLVMGTGEGKLMTTTAAATLILLWCGVLLIRPAVSQSADRSVGDCRSFDVNLLGSLGTGSQSGLIAQQLLYESQNTTTVLPRVLVLEAVVTCLSSSRRRDTFGTVAILVKYNCSGGACIHPKSALGYSTYTHHFSFACDPSNNQWTHFSTTGVHAFTNRYVTSSVQTARRAANGQCSFCTSDITSIPHQHGLGSNFIEETGCVGTSDLSIICRGRGFPYMYSQASHYGFPSSLMGKVLYYPGSLREALASHQKWCGHGVSK